MIKEVIYAWYLTVPKVEYIGELVRCKECRYRDTELCPMYKLTRAGVLKSDDYCSYGEKRQ